MIVLFLHSFSFLNYLDTPDAPTLNKDNLNRFEQTIEGIVNLKSYRFIGERELAAVNTVTKDGIDSLSIFTTERMESVQQTKKQKYSLVL